MSPRTFVARGAALLALASLGLAACESKTVIPPTPPPALQILVTPSSLSFTAAGQKAQVVASLTGGDTGQAAQGVTWSSSNSAVATVDQSGVVTAVANGTTTIVATSKALSSVVGAASVVVNIPVPPKPDTTKPAPPSVSIASITKQNGDQVDLTSVQGTIYVTLNVDVPTGNVVSSVNWLIDGKTVCTQAFTAPKSAGLSVASATASTVTCQINTTTLAAPLNANGAHQLSATLVGPSGTVTATSSQTLVFNNQNSVSVSLTADTSAFAANGIVWFGKNLTATATPTIFSGANVGRVIFNLVKASDNSVIATYTDTVPGPFTVVFAQDSTRPLPAGAIFAKTSSGQIFIMPAITDSVNVTVNTVTTAGTTGPASGTGNLRYDDQAPAITTAGAAPTSGWIKNGSLGTSTFGFAATDAGVNSVTFQVQARDTGTTTWNNVAAASDVGDKAAGAEQFRIKACDRLMNCVNSATYVAGVDIEAPVVQFVSPTIADSSKIKTLTTQEWKVGFNDIGPSGFNTNTPITAKISADTGAGPDQCGGGSTYDATNKVCTTFQTASDIPVPAVQGYQLLTAYAVDVAGNKSSTLTRGALVDFTPPQATADTVQTQPLGGGASETIRGYYTDNLVLGKATASVVYTGVFNKVLGTATFGTYGQFVKAATADFTDPFFLRALEAAPGGAWVLATGFAGTVTDLVGNATAYSLALAGAPTAPSTDPFASVITGTTTVSSDTTAQKITAALTVSGATVTSPPNSQVLIYQVDASGNATLVGTGTNPVITTTVAPAPGTATFTYTITPTTTLTNKNGGTIYAVFVTSGGVGLYTSKAIGQ